ncbi:probable E3 ubiquitin-protein ligase ZFP1 [Cornus florida]|uniref:probable E3 ubiquitin-protein ligase ZFP1 n=1 Tax=Cornus florida TaxID=4283 RepID=UPI00289BDEA6|nr:probable E3 ubiquitin-protein ligase ZFP1 [Cornus florida]
MFDSWSLRQFAIAAEKIPSYDLSKMGLDWLLVGIKVYQVTYDEDFRVIDRRVEISFKQDVSFSELQSDHSFFSRFLRANGVPENADMMEELISVSRDVIRCTRGNRKWVFFDPVQAMVLHVRYVNHSSSTSALNRALEESIQVVPKTLPASKESISALEKMVIDPMEIDDGSFSVNDECMICLLKFHLGVEVVTRMPCCHMYHGECIVPWLQANHSCPVCRFEIPV